MWQACHMPGVTLCYMLSFQVHQQARRKSNSKVHCCRTREDRGEQYTWYIDRMQPGAASAGPWMGMEETAHCKDGLSETGLGSCLGKEKGAGDSFSGAGR